MQDNEIPMRSISDVQVGDIVVCSTNKNWCDPTTLGKVKAYYEEPVPLRKVKGASKCAYILLRGFLLFAVFFFLFFWFCLPLCFVLFFFVIRSPGRREREFVCTPVQQNSRSGKEKPAKYVHA